ncbi:hypothetical protein N7461_000473 [Penicillium sp. DV-2018c]|nr:hypothetical protein N7461_000473 [Penicillium sp. DV-2018c]
MSQGFHLCSEFVQTIQYYEGDTHPVIGGNLDDGLWLYDGNAKLEDVRQLQQHAWITDPFHDDGRDDPPDEEDQRCPDSAGILNWVAKVHKHDEERYRLPVYGIQSIPIQPEVEK